MAAGVPHFSLLCEKWDFRRQTVDDPPRARQQHSQVSQSGETWAPGNLQRKRNPQPIPVISNLVPANTFLGLEPSGMLPFC
jgi:hypothetical protein